MTTSPVPNSACGPRAKALVDAFIDGAGRVSREALLERLYGCTDESSVRYRETQRANLQKLVSRVRTVGLALLPGEEWLTYHHGRAEWRLTEHHLRLLVRLFRATGTGQVLPEIPCAPRRRRNKAALVVPEAMVRRVFGEVSV
jgi:hypothetical protein